MEEATHTARWMFYIKHKQGPLDPGPDFANVDGQERHLQFWATHDHRPLARRPPATSRTTTNLWPDNHQPLSSGPMGPFEALRVWFRWWDLSSQGY